MNQTDMPDKDRPAPSRIPVRFDEDGGEGEAGEANNDSGLTPEELGEASIYEDAGEMRRRINRGEEGDTEEGREQADDTDVAGTIHPSELPRSRNEQDTTPSHADDDAKSGYNEADRADDPPRKAGAGDGPAIAELVATRAELRRVEAELRKADEERKDLLDKLSRRAADFDNFRKRTERERKDTYNNALGEVVGKFLPVLDNLQRALESERSREASESEEFRHFLHGVELIGRQLAGVLEALGVETVPTVGQPFDPHVHEAVAAVETDEYEADHVVEEMRRGYRLGDKLLRPAMVKVAK